MVFVGAAVYLARPLLPAHTHTEGTTVDTAIIAGIVAVAVALLGTYLKDFAAERYKRHKDACAIAAGLAGELAAYAPTLPILLAAFDTFLQLVDSGKRGEIVLEKIERPSDKFYDKAVDKLGLLGPELVEDIVFVYSNIAAFRMTFENIAVNRKDMSDAQLRGQILGCRFAVTNAKDKGVELIERLRLRGKQSFQLFDS